MSNSLNLPDLEFGIESSDTILNRFLTTLKNLFNISLSPADPYYNLLSAFAYVIAVEKASICLLYTSDAADE